SSSRTIRRLFFVFVFLSATSPVAFFFGDEAVALGAVGISASVAVMLALAFLVRRNLVRMRSVPPTAARIDSITNSTWQEYGPSFTIRLVRIADGAPMGDHSIKPPPHRVNLIRPGGLLLVQWHPELPQELEIHWNESPDLLALH